MRPALSLAPALSLLDRRPELLFDIEVAVVTPLFGGGPVARQTDPYQPVRASSIRGHLRFWWRACRAARFASSEDLFREEERIWGSTKRPSRVVIAVRCLDVGREVACATYRRGGDGKLKGPDWHRDPSTGAQFPAYALFPFQGEIEYGQLKRQPDKARIGVRFGLQITVTDEALAPERGMLPPLATDEIAREVRAALWAWLSFGGVGSRTRRGCGSLACADPAFTPSGDPVAWLLARAAEHVISGTPRLPLPVLTGAKLLLGQEDSPLACWGTAVKLMSDFRQRPGFARNDINPETRRPGRSRWPEPDAIRRIADAKDPRHDPVHPAERYFPRADLGLPIVFHFQGERDLKDGPILAAEMKDATRMASPVVLKPFALGGGTFRPMALLLQAPHVWDKDISVSLKLKRQPDRPISGAALFSRRASTLVSPLKTNEKDTARMAFMRFAEKEWKRQLETLP
ncbi:MAG TPA: type III-B CRISPR module RAMP protein Cmr1 [Chloroflexota bacterium]|nr:type III-B CRISPR module RAMP protein Cmr1 [Chloroflexota bacterium]